jgi:PhzF family phenazine biosynthesis protein
MLFQNIIQMKIPLYHIDAFTGKIFHGNPAAVCPLEKWIPEEVMQSIAAENNLSETAFFTGSKGRYHIRWFTPLAEIDLCGHATLASAYIIFNRLDRSLKEVVFDSKNGPLVVRNEGSILTMDFPSQAPKPCRAPKELLLALNCKPVEVLKAADYVVLLPDEKSVRDIEPDMEHMKKLDLRGVAVTARGEEADFVSRFFVSKYGIQEDPVTGSSHCELAPYWSKKLGKKEMRALQLSKRGGEILCRDMGERVLISGRAVLYMEGVINL